MMYSFGDTPPDLAAMFQALHGGIVGEPPHHLFSAWAVGGAMREAEASEQAIAAGLRMVADAIDPPAMVEAGREIADTLGPSMLTPDEWEARLRARNMERHIHNIACFDIYGKLSIGCPDYDPPDAVNPCAKPYDDALAARERLRRHGLEKD